MTIGNLQKAQQKIGKAVLYTLQKTIKWQFDQNIEQALRDWAHQILDHDHLFAEEPHWQQISLEDIDLEDKRRYSLFQIDIDKKRFSIDLLGEDIDYFGRKGTWIPRGTRIFYDKVDKTFLKIFEPYSADKGEAHFLEHALKSGLYDNLCPHLVATIKDSTGNFRGYIIKEGRTLTLYEFQRYIKSAMGELICAITKKTGYYFYDLFSGNVILLDGKISFIDLESILPIDWYGQDTSFAKNHLHEIDLGWEIQTKFASPKWYSDFLKDLKKVESC